MTRANRRFRHGSSSKAEQSASKGHRIGVCQRVIAQIGRQSKQEEDVRLTLTQSTAKNVPQRYWRDNFWTWTRWIHAKYCWWPDTGGHRRRLNIIKGRRHGPDGWFRRGTVPQRPFWIAVSTCKDNRRLSRLFQPATKSEPNLMGVCKARTASASRRKLLQEPLNKQSFEHQRVQTRKGQDAHN